MKNLNSNKARQKIADAYHTIEAWQMIKRASLKEIGPTNKDLAEGMRLHSKARAKIAEEVALLVEVYGIPHPLYVEQEA